MENLFSLKDKIAIVTGANGLLGVNHCTALQNAGAIVVGCDLKFEESASTETIHRFEMDVTDKNSIESVYQEILRLYGTIDILVNNAAVNDMFENPALALENSKFENYPIEMWQKSFNVNVTGVYLCSQVFGSHMANRSGGSIINIASTYGVVGPDQQLYVDDQGIQNFYKSPAYPSTKAAVIGFTKYLAAYWGKNNVRVNALCPGGVENNQEKWFVQNYAARTCLQRMANVDDYRGALIYLASDASSYMTGANLIVDGGWTAI
ncbi:MAG: SDR family oxidoreductase [Saprospiraceae bacterium]|nr:SDR family oxidoreductase [Saprospiraceae bacterium]